MNGQGHQARPPTRMSQHGDEPQEKTWQRIKNALWATFCCCNGTPRNDFRDLDGGEQRNPPPTRASTPMTAPVCSSRRPSVHELSENVQRAIRAKGKAKVPAQPPPSYEQSIPPNPRVANQGTEPPEFYSPTARLVRKSSEEHEQESAIEEHAKESEGWNKQLAFEQRKERLAREEEEEARQYQTQLEKLRAARQRKSMENGSAETRLESSSETSPEAEQPLARGPSAASEVARSQFRARFQPRLDDMHDEEEVDTPTPPARALAARIPSSDLSTLPSVRRRTEEAQHQEAERNSIIEQYREDSAEETRAAVAMLMMESECNRAAVLPETPGDGRSVELPSTPETSPRPFSAYVSLSQIPNSPAPGPERDGRVI
ncbi:hypothetical protein BST61_g7198 [Cercospora zeina]